LAIFRSPFRLAITLVVLCILGLPALSSAQQIDVNGMPYDTEGQLMGCPPHAVLPPAASAKLISCQKADSVEVSLPLKPDANGNAKEKRVRGAYEFREYGTKNLEQDFTFQSLLDALPAVGFVVKYSYKPSTITARNGDLWILINVSDDTYNTTIVRAPSEEWPTVKTAEEISREMQVHNRVDIYGIEFSPDDQSILEKESQILFEILKYLKQNNDMSVIVESDKITPSQPPEVDSEITRERANAVMDWLIAHGIARPRVQPRPAGRNNPITENESSSEIQRNERIVLIKAAT
jgi:hypothetical protein